MKQMILNVKKFLYNELTVAYSNFATNDNKQTAWSDIRSARYWYLHNNSQEMCFIDLIKGLVPTDLFNNLHTIANDKPKAQNHINSLMAFIFKESQEIWKSRNEQVALIPAISQKSKKFWEHRRQYRNHITTVTSMTPGREEYADIERKYDSWQEIIDWQLMNGRHLSGFWKGNNFHCFP